MRAFGRPAFLNLQIKGHATMNTHLLHAADRWVLATALALAAAAIAPTAQAGWVGGTVGWTLETPRGTVVADRGTALVGQTGQEFNAKPFNDFVIDANGNSINLRNLGNLPVSFQGTTPSGFLGFAFTDVNRTISRITGVRLTANDVTGFDASRVTFDDDNVYINLNGVATAFGEDLTVEISFEDGTTSALLGQDLQWSFRGPTPADVIQAIGTATVVLLGQEFQPQPLNDFIVDFFDDRVSIRYLGDIPSRVNDQPDFFGFHFRDVLGDIEALTGVELGFGTVVGLGAAQISFSADDLWIDLRGAEWSFGNELLLRTTFASNAVPLPATLPLVLLGLGLGCLAAGGGRRHARRAAQVAAVATALLGSQSQGTLAKKFLSPQASTEHRLSLRRRRQPAACASC